jgi:histidinol-phosphatase (PHP family)
MALADYHIHTYLCEHATGQPDDYIGNALKRGLAEIGFADHAPLPEGLREGITMRAEDMESYLTLIGQMQEVYRDDIAVRLGLEVDFPLHPSFDLRYCGDHRIDFLIGSCHFLDGWAFDHPREAAEFEKRDIDDVYSGYYALLTKLIRSRLFDIIGHFDLVKKFGHREKRDFSADIREAARLCAGAGIAVEINTAGLRKPVREMYPSERIVSILFEENVPVTLGSDAHAPEETAFGCDAAVAMLTKAGYRKICGFSKRKRYDITL